MPDQPRQVHVLGDSEIMSIWVGSGNDPGNTRIDLSHDEFDQLIDYFRDKPDV